MSDVHCEWKNKAVITTYQTAGLTHFIVNLLKQLFIQSVNESISLLGETKKHTQNN